MSDDIKQRAKDFIVGCCAGGRKLDEAFAMFGEIEAYRAGLNAALALITEVAVEKEGGK